MDIWVLDKNFINIGVIDGYESLIWTERYATYGDFELYVPMNMSLLDIIKNNHYFWITDSDMVMIIETIQIKTDAENGDHLIVSGRSLESLLNRRIVWSQTRFSNKNLQAAIKQLIQENMITPSIPQRKIDRFAFEESADEKITSLKLSVQYTGDNLLDVLQDICKANGIGFRVRLDNNMMYFSLYAGEDRSYDQNKNPYVVFSPSYENLASSNYLKSNRDFRNVALVAGEDSAQVRRTRVIGTASGLDRRELYVDARDIQSETDSGDPIPTDQYNSLLDNRGRENLLEHQEEELLEGSIDASSPYSYRVDFLKGDIVQLVNEYGMEFKVRILEFVRCQDTTGYSTYPTFEILTSEKEGS